MLQILNNTGIIVMLLVMAFICMGGIFLIIAGMTSVIQTRNDKRDFDDICRRLIEAQRWLGEFPQIDDFIENILAIYNDKKFSHSIDNFREILRKKYPNAKD